MDENLGQEQHEFSTNVSPPVVVYFHHVKTQARLDNNITDENYFRARAWEDYRYRHTEKHQGNEYRLCCERSEKLALHIKTG